MPPPIQCCAGGFPPSIPLARDLFRCYTIPKHKGGVLLNSISDLLKVSLGSFTLGKLLSAALTLAVCILAVRLLNKLAAKLLSRRRDQLAGKLVFLPDVLCTHHGEGHGEGHSCGSHGCGGHCHE